MVECYSRGVKNSLLVANLIMFVSGAVVLALGIWTVTDRSFMERLLGLNLYIVSTVLLIVTGTIVALIALLGFLGAYKEVNSMLKSYFAILLALLSLIITIGLVCFIFKAELNNKLHSEMLSSMKLYGNDSYVTEAWDSLQTNFACCGVNDASRNVKGFELWRLESKRFNSREGPLVPESCCRNSTQTKPLCLGKQPNSNDTFTEGCYEKMKAIIMNHTTYIGIVALFIVLFIAFGLILSGSLFLILRTKINNPANDKQQVLSET